MSTEQEQQRIRKLIINGKEYVELNELRQQILLLGMSEMLKGNLPGALGFEALASTLDKDDIYDVYPKKSEAVGEESNLVSLFGTNKE